MSMAEQTMTPEPKKETTPAQTTPTNANETSSRKTFSGRRGQGQGHGQGKSRGDRGGHGGRRGRNQEDQEFAQKVIEIARVTRVMAGGKRMSFRAAVMIGDKKGRIGFGVKKGADVSMAVNKAVNQAKKNLMHVTMSGTTIPHEVGYKYAAARVFLKPAPEGTGILAGGAVRSVLELAGLKDVVGKMFGSRNKINNIRAAMKALEILRARPERKKKETASQVTTVETKKDA